MKMYKAILTLVCGSAVLASCSNLNETPSFSKSESYVSFAKAKASVDENGGSITIPVNMASISPIATSVSYVITPGTAAETENYSDTNESAVLTFDGTSRSAEIVVNIVDHSGEYTGDLDFTIELLSATGMKIGAENTCTVTIGDLDHPLAAILGSYDASAVSYWDGAVSWTMTLYKDAKDVNVVWIDGVTNEFLGEANRFYANVVRNDDDEIVAITAPSGQYVYYPGMTTYWCRLVGWAADAGNNFAPNAALTWLYDSATGTFAMDPSASISSLGIVIYGPNDKTVAYGWYNRYTVAPTYVKQ